MRLNIINSSLWYLNCIFGSKSAYVFKLHFDFIFGSKLRIYFIKYNFKLIHRFSYEFILIFSLICLLIYSMCILNHSLLLGSELRDQKPRFQQYVILAPERCTFPQKSLLLQTITSKYTINKYSRPILLHTMNLDFPNVRILFIFYFLNKIQLWDPL